MSIAIIFSMPENNPYNQEGEELDEEQRYATELAAEQELYAAQAEAEGLYNQGQEFRRPSLFKYFILALLALIVDIIDIIDLTGIGIIIGRIISFAVSAVIILVFWFTNTKQKRADEYVENVQKKIEDIRAIVANAEKNILRVARLSRKVPGVKKLYRKIHLKTIRRARVAIKRVAKSAKSPLIRSAAAGALNLVPLLALVPWMLVGIWLSYKAEKESYKNAREEADSVLEATEETETV